MLVQKNLVTLYSEHFTPSHRSTIYSICGRKKLLNEMVIVNYKTAEKDKGRETKRKANKDMNRDSESVYLSAKGSTSTKILVHLHITRRFRTLEWTRLSFETSLYTQLKFIPPTQWKSLCCIRIFHRNFCASNNRAYNNINKQISSRARSQS